MDRRNFARKLMAGSVIGACLPAVNSGPQAAVICGPESVVKNVTILTQTLDEREIQRIVLNAIEGNRNAFTARLRRVLEMP